MIPQNTGANFRLEKQSDFIPYSLIEHGFHLFEDEEEKEKSQRHLEIPNEIPIGQE